MIKPLYPKSKSPKSPDDSEAAFVLEGDDRFHSILVSDGVKYETAPDHETVLTFFVIRRTSGLFEIVNVLKTFNGSQCVSRNVQAKKDIPARAIAHEVNAVVSVFGGAVEKATGHKLTWHRLDLSNVESMPEQVRLIRKWGRVSATTDWE